MLSVWLFPFESMVINSHFIQFGWDWKEVERCVGKPESRTVFSERDDDDIDEERDYRDEPPPRDLFVEDRGRVCFYYSNLRLDRVRIHGACRVFTMRRPVPNQDKLLKLLEKSRKASLGKGAVQPYIRKDVGMIVWGTADGSLNYDFYTKPAFKQMCYIFELCKECRKESRDWLSEKDDL